MLVLFVSLYKCKLLLKLLALYLDVFKIQAVLLVNIEHLHASPPQHNPTTEKEGPSA
jgi:hypothetical protein